MTSPTELATHLLGRLAMNGKPSLHEIAQRIGLRIQEVDAEGFEGTLVRALDGPKGIIGVARSIRESTRKRFTIAHEIGHYVIPSHRKLENVCSSDMVESWKKALPSPELEANEFAIELLLPFAFVRQPLRLTNPSFKTIRIVANLFETSLTATTCRFVDLTDLPCVALWSEQNRMKWYRRSAGFPLYLPKEALPCDGSVAYRLFQGGIAPDDFVDVPAESWLDREDIHKVVRVLEHSINLPSYDAVLTLLWFKLREISDVGEPPALEDMDPEEFTIKRKRWPR